MDSLDKRLVSERRDMLPTLMLGALSRRASNPLESQVKRSTDTLLLLDGEMTSIMSLLVFTASNPTVSLVNWILLPILWFVLNSVSDSTIWTILVSQADIIQVSSWWVSKCSTILTNSSSSRKNVLSSCIDGWLKSWRSTPMRLHMLVSPLSKKDFWRGREEGRAIPFFNVHLPLVSIGAFWKMEWDRQ